MNNLFKKLNLQVILLASLGTCFSLNASTQYPIARFEGGTKDYAKCNLYGNGGSISIGTESKGNFAIENSKAQMDQYDIRNLAGDAVIAIPGSHYQWSPMQISYFARSYIGLERFYARGLTNILNTSVASNKLRKIIDHVCSEKLLKIRSLGEFDIELEIGNRVFKDKLIFKHKFVSGMSYNYIEGEYIVPGSFKSKINDLDYRDGNFSFTIHVVEGEQDYHVIFEGSFIDKMTFSGEAYILPERKLLGSFIGKKGTSDE